MIPIIDCAPPSEPNYHQLTCGVFYILQAIYKIVFVIKFLIIQFALVQTDLGCICNLKHKYVLEI